MTYNRKYKEWECIQYTKKCEEYILTFSDGAAKKCKDYILVNGTIVLNIGDWIMKDWSGNITACNKDIFEKEYEKTVRYPERFQVIE